MTTDTNVAPETSQLPWFVTVTENENNILIPHAEVVHLLTCEGCDRIEPLGCGTAWCHIPRQWEQAVRQWGSISHRVLFLSNPRRRFKIDIGLLDSNRPDDERAPD
jgi:hypothetical protein